MDIANESDESCLHQHTDLLVLHKKLQDISIPEATEVTCTAQNVQKQRMVNEISGRVGRYTRPIVVMMLQVESNCASFSRA